MAEAEVEYEIASSPSDLGPAPELGKKLIVLPEWRKPNGKANAFVAHELSTGEHDEFDRSDKVYDKFGQVTRLKVGSKQYEWLARTMRDGDGQRIWHSAESCEETLKPVGKLITNKMVAAANQINYGDDASTPDEAAEDAEGKSDGA